MSQYKLTRLRIQKQLHQIQQHPLDNTIVSIKHQRQIHFCFYNIEQPFKDGFYHGVLQLPENYPFSAPKFKFMTNNGRFEVNKYVCTTFTSYHQESWSSSWTIRTILTAILSFFLSDETGYGTIEETEVKRQYLASRSLQMNLLDEEFCQMFVTKLKERGIKHPKLDCEQQNIPQMINLQEITHSLNDNIGESKGIIESMMLVQNDGNGQANVHNNSNRVIKMLYLVLIVVVLVVVFRSF